MLLEKHAAASEMPGSVTKLIGTAKARSLCDYKYISEDSVTGCELCYQKGSSQYVVRFNL